MLHDVTRTGQQSLHHDNSTTTQQDQEPLPSAVAPQTIHSNVSALICGLMAFVNPNDFWRSLSAFLSAIAAF